MNIPAFVPGTFYGLHPSEIELFRRVLANRVGLGLEIGCCDGYSTAHILAFSRLCLVSVDPFIPDSMAPELIGSRERLSANVEPWKDRHRLIEDYSARARLQFEDKPILRFLFIDGDHREAMAMMDLRLWTPLLMKGGLLAMHDSRHGLPGGPSHHYGPTRALQRVILTRRNSWRVIGESHSLTVVERL